MTEIKGRLFEKGKNWTIDNYEFTVDARLNPWVVRNLRKFSNQGTKVICRVNEDRVLLSVRVA